MLTIVFCQVETGKKTLILHGTKTSQVLNDVMTEIYHLKRDNSVKYTRKNDNIRPFESGGETSLEFFSLKTDCSLFVVSGKRSFSLETFFWGSWVEMCCFISCSMLIWIHNLNFFLWLPDYYVCFFGLVLTLDISYLLQLSSKAVVLFFYDKNLLLSKDIKIKSTTAEGAVTKDIYIKSTTGIRN